ncbi:MAG: peptide deformylase [Prolixibacteraceae bacterium]|nr:peptide deformylase [Prolixibacteraceae bacterium]
MKSRNILLVVASVIVLLLGFSGCKTDGFSKDEVELITSDEANSAMRLYTIKEKSDSLLLRQEARNIRIKHIGSETLEHLKSRMFATMTDTLNPGVGIAAPQVGIGVKMIWAQRFDKPDEPFEVFYNPVITEYSDSINSGDEGCLSVPGYRGKVDRSQNITLVYLDSLGDKKTESISGFTAVILQHEVDHVNGILYYDRIHNGFDALTIAEE